jgi:hypothetical protein
MLFVTIPAESRVGFARVTGKRAKHDFSTPQHPK